MGSPILNTLIALLATIMFMISTVMACSSCPHDCLLAYYPFEGDGTDSSGNNRDGTTTGDVSYAAGQCGQAASFNGASKMSVQSFANFAWGTSSVSVYGSSAPVIGGTTRASSIMGITLQGAGR
ncbi:uncharacterized protein LOC115929463 [Strongylocentrotus purpuratus]|uniref:Uncharacterized protein n=1 Tax=Strongylocentrotus purpuratus TaxID=7668 RepID=A0A7M7PNA4_STRPU|nr:uncharacterized protein LOC115929463 [Strongylocentrotus purpuratus]